MDTLLVLVDSRKLNSSPSHEWVDNKEADKLRDVKLKKFVNAFKNVIFPRASRALFATFCSTVEETYNFSEEL